MKNIFVVISGLSGTTYLSPAQETDVVEAERALGLFFADEYRRYLKTYGAVSGQNFELTGIGFSKKVCVVSATERARNNFPCFPKDMYVIEETGAEDLLILQNRVGEVFSYFPEVPPQKLFDSMAEFLEDFYGQKRKGIPIGFI